MVHLRKQQIEGVFKWVELTLYTCTCSMSLCSKRPEIPLHFSFGFDVCLVVSVNDTLLLEMVKSFDHVVLTIPVGDPILWFHTRYCRFESWQVGAVDLVDKDGPLMSNGMLGPLVSDDIGFEVGVFAEDS